MSKKNYAYLIGGKFTVEIVLPLALKFCKHLNFSHLPGATQFLQCRNKDQTWASHNLII